LPVKQQLGGQTAFNEPSGYSCVCVDSADHVFVLAEVGKVNYNEALVFLKVKQ
jgi:hypothetical protein